MSPRVDWTIKVRDVLTTLTVAISVAALVLSWSKDRAAQKTERANQVRAAAAGILTKLDRWQALQLSLYQELQPTFVEASEQLQKQYNIVVVRDQVWKNINAQRQQKESKNFKKNPKLLYPTF